MRALRGAGIIFAGIVGAAAFIFLLAVYFAGLLWVSKNVLDYLNIAAAIAVAACVFVLLPLASFRSTREFSAYGFLISSAIFGASTWILGLLVTFDHWGVTGVLVGLTLAGVGIVPVGMLASAFHAVWPQVGYLALGLVLTFGARTIAILLAQRLDRDEAGISSNSPSEAGSISFSAMSCATGKWREWVRLDRIQSQQIIMTALFMLVVGGLAVYEALHPSRSNSDYLQLVANLNAHPIASVFGALLPAVFLSPLAYWMFGRILRRNAARFKVCEHCAETIKVAAKVCRYCGRDVAPARQVEDQQQAEDEQRRPGAAANQLEYVQGTLAVAAPLTLSARRIGGTGLRMLPQPSRSVLVTACVLGLFLVGSAAVWLANTQRTAVPPDVPSFDDLPSSESFEVANAAFGKGDYTTALRLFRPLADQGNALAQFNVGWMYASGQGVRKNDAEAVRWYRLAADQANSASQTSLGLMYYEGRGVQQSDAEAVRWWRKAADQGDAQAQYNLGLMYDEGRGVQQNYVWAHMWYNLSAKQGNQDAIKNQKLVAQLMTSAQIAEALRFARSWKSKRVFSDAEYGLLPDVSALKQSAQRGPRKDY